MMERKQSIISPPRAETAGADFVLSIAGLSVRVSGIPASEARILQSLLSAMSDPSADRPADLGVSWVGLNAIAQPGHRRIRAGSQEHIPSLTLILLLERLCVARPGLHLLHGNAIAVSSSGRAILLVGNSGAGKTTLTRELLSTSDNRLLAEDTLLLDLDKDVLHPFPRAASLRIDSESHDGPTTDHHWRGLGVRRVEKALVPPQRIHTTPFPLSLTDIVLLNIPERDTGRGSNVEEVSGEIYWLSHVDPSLLPLIRDQISPDTILSEPTGESAYPSLGFSKPLAPQQRARLISLLARDGSMILASHPAGRIPSFNRTSRPANPVIHRAAPFDALRRLLDFSVAFGAPDLPTADPSRLLMRLAHVFSGTRFLFLTPGGTPTDTIACLRVALDAKPS